MIYVTTMYCPACGTEVPDEANFCDACGQALDNPAAQPSEAENATAMANRSADDTPSAETTQHPVSGDQQPGGVDRQSTESSQRVAASNRQGEHGQYVTDGQRTADTGQSRQPDPPQRTDPASAPTQETSEQIARRVGDENEGRDPRLVGLGYLVLGLVLLGIAYWAGVVGHTEMRGFTEVKTTYPIAALLFGGFGALSTLAGLMGLAGVDLSEE